MRIFILSLLLTLTFTDVKSQGMDCEKFKSGNFQNLDSKDSSTFIKRKGNYQYETDKSTGSEIKLKITWISECTYRLKFIKGNDVWNKGEHLKDNPDLIVEIIETGADYYIQEARFVGLDDFKYKSKMKLIE